MSWKCGATRRLRLCMHGDVRAGADASPPRAHPPLRAAAVSKVSNRLVAESKRFKWGAKKLNSLDAWKRWLPLIVTSLIVAALLWWRFGA